MAQSTRPNERPPRSIVARVVAALALAGVAVALFAVISSGTSGSEDDKSTKPRKDRGAKLTEPEPNEYTVVAGDTLSGIAQKTDTPIAKLQRLNPDLDSETVNAGQVIQLK